MNVARVAAFALLFHPNASAALFFHRSDDSSSRPCCSMSACRSAPKRASSIARERASTWLKTAGTSVFWVLVVGIVLARAVYFEPGVFSFERAVAWAQGLFAAL